jgi:alpha-L-fucosidase
VPSWSPKGSYAEWYGFNAKQKDNPVRAFHLKNYGADFDYRKFGELLRGELFDANAWAELFARSGAKYVVMAANYHDGFCLWPSAYSPGWNAVETGPKRDALGEVSAAVRKRGLVMGIYYSLYEWYHPLWLSDRPRYVSEHFHPQFKDVITRYQPWFIFADGEWEADDKLWRSEELLAWLFNESPVRDTVVVNDRWGNSRGKHGTIYESEYGGGNMAPTHPWQEDRGIGASYGYNRNEDIGDYNTRGQLLQMLTKCAGNGGNLLLNVGPAADGTIPVIMQERLLQVGEWLARNGEAIYATTASPFWPRTLPFGACTQKPGKLFLHVHGRPGDALELPGLQTKITRAYFCADPTRALATRATPQGSVAIQLPDYMPDPDVSVVVVELDGAPVIDATARQANDGTISLRAVEAMIHGATPRYETGSGKDNIGFWGDPKDYVSWDIKVTAPGTFGVRVVYSCEKGCEGSRYDIEVAGQKLAATSKATGSWATFAPNDLGTLTIDKAGAYTLSVKPRADPQWKVIGLRSIVLTPVRS